MGRFTINHNQIFDTKQSKGHTVIHLTITLTSVLSHNIEDPLLAKGEHHIHEGGYELYLCLVQFNQLFGDQEKESKPLNHRPGF